MHTCMDLYSVLDFHELISDIILLLLSIHEASLVEPSFTNRCAIKFFLNGGRKKALGAIFTLLVIFFPFLFLN